MENTTTKKCSSCKRSKKVNLFAPRKDRTSGYKSACRKCENDRKIELRKTKNGVIARIYENQVSHSKLRGHNRPTYTLRELKKWVLSKQLFHKLYDIWVEGSYQKKLKPSVDRKNDYIGYSMDNIQLMTWGENAKKACEDIILGRSTSGERCKAVIKYDKNYNKICEYHSMKEAERQTGITQQNISKACNREREFAGGYRWKVKDE